MALIILSSGRARTVSHNQALEIQAVKDGNMKGTDKQRLYASNVKKVYFSKQHSQAEQELAWFQK